MEILKNNFYCHSNFSERNFVLYFFPIFVLVYPGLHCSERDKCTVTIIYKLTKMKH